MKLQIVVARYNEDIEWIKPFPNVLIYNKGTSLTTDFTNVIQLKNVGREGHTYYKHIYDNYEKLADYTIFLQGYPYDHSSGIVNDINAIIDNRISIENFKFLSGYISRCKLSGCGLHPGLPLKEVYENIFNEKKEDTYSFEFGCGAQFAVSKQRILERSREFYLKIVKLLEYSENPIEGFCVERFHSLIFSEKIVTG